jgi:uncharacterized membrane protein
MTRALGRRRTLLWPALVVVLCLVVIRANTAETASALRTAAVVAFLTLAPGFGLVDLLGVQDGWRELALVIGLSLAIDVLVVAAFQYAGDSEAWHPLAVLIGIALTGTVADMFLRGARRSREEAGP